MIKPYSRKDVENIYGDLIRSAYKNYAKQRYHEALKDIIAASNWAYCFNHIYTDPSVENLVKLISESKVKGIEIKSPKGNRCVLIDSFLLDNRGLSQQYFRAMMALGMEILVVYTNRGGIVGKDLLKEIKEYNKATILLFPKNIDAFEQTRMIVDHIEEFMPTHLFFHLTPWDVVALMASHAINGVKKYNINLTDHAYWMGASFIDYNLEFRPYGMTVSLEKRGLKKEQLLALPYYPVTPLSTEFCCFPDIPNDAVKVFTGGALYKILGKNGFFFHIMERILSISPSVYILVAGFDKEARFDKGIENIQGKERIVQIGVRKDIDEVFDHIDIYLSTYPMIGGLMTQYAAKHGKPIVAYHDKGDAMNTVEEIVNYYQHEFKSFTDLDLMTAYAEKLIKDIKFRENEGRVLQKGMMNKERFNAEFSNIIQNHMSSFCWAMDSIDYDSFFDRYLDLENNNGYSATMSLIRNQKLGFFTKIDGFNKKIGIAKYAVRNISPRNFFQGLLNRFLYIFRK